MTGFVYNGIANVADVPAIASKVAIQAFVNPDGCRAHLALQGLAAKSSSTLIFHECAMRIRLNPRERAAVDEWILSGKSFHIMRDSYHHRRRMLGGMWGGIGGKIPGIKGLIDNWWRFDQNGGSDRFLSEVIYAMVKDDCFCHDSIKHFRDEETHDFPAHEALEGTSFVGEIVTSDHQRMDIWRRLGELDDRHLLLEEELTQRIRCLESESVVVSLRELERKVMEEISDMRRRTTEIFSKLLRMEQKEESRKRALLEIASQIKSIQQSLSQPEGSTAPSNLDELFLLYDESFVSAAYWTILGREPDPVGMEYFLGLLRSGVSKIRILYELYLSDEGRSNPPMLPGLAAALRRYRRTRIPVIGRLLGLYYKVDGDSPSERRMRSIQNQLLAIAPRRSRSCLNSPDIDQTLRSAGEDLSDEAKQIYIQLRKALYQNAERKI